MVPRYGQLCLIPQWAVLSTPWSGTEGTFCLSPPLGWSSLALPTHLTAHGQPWGPPDECIQHRMAGRLPDERLCDSQLLLASVFPLCKMGTMTLLPPKAAWRGGAGWPEALLSTIMSEAPELLGLPSLLWKDSRTGCSTQHCLKTPPCGQCCDAVR